MHLAGLSWKTLLGSCLVLFLSLFITFSLVTSEIERVRNEGLRHELEAEMLLLKRAFHGGWANRDHALLEGLLAHLKAGGVDMVVGRDDGTVLLDTTGGRTGQVALLSFPEVASALRTGRAQGVHRGLQRAPASQVIAEHFTPENGSRLVLWLAQPVWRLQNDRPAFGRLLGTFLTVGVILLLLLVIVLSYRWTRLLRRIAAAARRLSQGDLTVRADVPGSDEWALLARSLNETRRRLRTDAETIDRQRRTLDSLVTQIREGVAVVDHDGRLVLINPAAVKLLDLRPAAGKGLDWFVGRTVEESLPQHELQRMLTAAREQREEEELVSGESTSRILGAPVRETQLDVETPDGILHLLARVSEIVLPAAAPEGESTGFLLVLTDITELNRALTMQTDFVSNASHELRTPLSTIRAAVETLQSMDLDKDAEEARRFLEIVDRHSERLSALVADLLSLSRLDAGVETFEPKPHSVGSILRGVRERFENLARTRELTLRTEADGREGQRVFVNLHLLQMALDNLVENAMKFTEPGGEVVMSFAQMKGGAAFEVRDTGCGIPEPDQRRVFERFYQVERARSGARRGTGLGLSIVQQATAAMGGLVSLRSQVGVGTTVTMRIPQAGESQTEAEDVTPTTRTPARRRNR